MNGNDSHSNDSHRNDSEPNYQEPNDSQPNDSEPNDGQSHGDRANSHFLDNPELYLAELRSLRDRLAETMSNADDPDMQSELAFQLEKVQQELDQLTAPPPEADAPEPEPHLVEEHLAEQHPVEERLLEEQDAVQAQRHPTEQYDEYAQNDGYTEQHQAYYEDEERWGPAPTADEFTAAEPEPLFATGQEPLVQSFSASVAETTGDHLVPFDGTGETPTSRNPRTIWPSAPVLTVVGICLALLAGLLWLGGRNPQPGVTAESLIPASAGAADPASQGTPEEVVANVRAVLVGLGLNDVVVDFRDGAIHLGGPVANQADLDAAVNAAQMVTGTYPVVSSALMALSPGTDTSNVADPDSSTQSGADRGAALQSELTRILASTPLIFNSGEAALSELHQRILNNIVMTVQAYPGADLIVAGFTDGQGSDDMNDELSLSRATNVRDYLASQGIAPDSIQIEARGADQATGSQAIAGLERRVEFIVTGVEASNEGPIRIAVVAPSASNDLAFTQSMVDAVNLIGMERTVELAITDNTFVPEEAAAAIRSYADQGFDLIIAHGSQFGASLVQIAPQFPDIAFAWGTASDTFGLPNVYSYDAAAHEGGYLLGALASRLSTSKTIGVVGPIEVGDAARYINGFTAGAAAENAATNVLVSYTGSFSDIGLAAEAADSHLAAGADVMAGSAQMVVGAIAQAQQQGALWFGTQANQTSLAPDIVVASQVYRWEVVLRPIIEDLSSGTLAGTAYTATLANGGLTIEYNSGYPLDSTTRQWAEDIAAAIAEGTIIPPG